MNTHKSAWDILIEAVIIATGRIARHKDVYDEFMADLDKHTAIMRQVMKDNIDTVLAEWKEATEATVSEGWLKELMNAQANEIALESLKRMELA
jgi:hypothetical protein